MAQILLRQPLLKQLLGQPKRELPQKFLSVPTREELKPRSKFQIAVIIVLIIAIITFITTLIFLLSNRDDPNSFGRKNKWVLLITNGISLLLGLWMISMSIGLVLKKRAKAFYGI